MTRTPAKYNYKQILITFAILIIATFAFYSYWANTKLVIREILEHPLTSFMVWAITIIIFVLHYWKRKDREFIGEAIVTKKYGIFIDSAFGGVAYATTINTSLTLLKGIYIQKFFPNDKIYFLEFQDIDLITIFGVSIFLLYYSLIKIIEIAIETYKVEQTGQVFNEQNVAVVQTQTSGSSLDE